MTTVLESSKLFPSAGSRHELSLPLVFFDMLWYNCPASQIVLLFGFPSLTKVHFLNDIVPRLKKSLSLTLTHFLPLAGNIIHPLNPLEMPLLRYRSTDSVSFTVSESTADFTHLTGNQPRSCDEFHALVPLLPRPARSDTGIAFPVLAVQVTLFPGKGISVGFATNHAAADASTVVSFIRSWALISERAGEGREGGEGEDTRALLMAANLFPVLDRETVSNIKGGLNSIYWEAIVKSSLTAEPLPVEFPINKVRATFVLKRDDIEKMKSFVCAKIPGVDHVSSFTVVCGLAWACWGSSAAPGGEDEPEYFIFAADCRGRVKPENIPATYLGNCVALEKAELVHGKVKKGAEGFVMAAAAIGREARNVEAILDGAEGWWEVFGKVAGKRYYEVTGSPRFNFYAADFGWGRAEKIEVVSIDVGREISLWRSRDFDGGLEIGVSMPALQMDAFATIFNHTLAELLHYDDDNFPLVSRY